MENKVVMGIIDDRAQLERAIESLRENGFRNADISALLPTPETTKEFVLVDSTKSPEGAATGGATGFVLGGALGWLAGIGAIAIPGFGPLIAIGPIMGLLAGAGVGGLAGGVAGALIGLGIPEYEAKRYEGMVQKGGYLLSVHCDNDDWVERAKAIIEDNGAHDLSTSDEKSSDDERSRHDVPREGARF